MKIYNIINIPKGLSPEVECECREEYLSGYTAGYEDGKNKGFQSGYTSGVTDGIEEGKEEQKSLMVYTAITENGTYSRENGYNEIFVDVPSYSAETYASGYTDGYSSGYTDGNEDGFESGYTSGYTDGTEDGFGSGFTSGYTEGYSSGYTDGLNASGQSYESGYTSGYTDGYGSGYTDGSEDGYGSGYTSGKTDGVAEQKAKLVAAAVTSNGTYSREDGFSSVSVNVPQTGHTDEEIAEAFSSGKTAGVDEQKAKLVATAFTGNGTFTRTDGWNSVTVNVSGYTQEDLDNAFRSGYTSGITDGYGSGWTDGYDSGYTDGYADGSGGTHSAATELSIVVPSAITGTGRATVEYQPSTAILDLVFTSSDPDIATISNNGSINVISAGTVNICAEDRNSGLYDCETITVEPQGSLDEPLTVNVLSAGTILWVADTGATPLTIEYQLNGGNWTSITSTVGGTSIPVVAGDIVKFRGDNSQYSTTASNEKSNRMLMQTGKYAVKGNIMSLVDSTGYTTATTFGADAFVYFFKDSVGLVDASGLILPAEPTLSCYTGMFYGCTSLTTAPALPATTLAFGCYGNMFNGCTSLVTAPKLPATALTASCYFNMFYGCTSLTTAPELPAPVLVQSCYSNLFMGCTNLNYIKCMAISGINTGSSTSGWVYSVQTNSGTFIKDPNSSWPAGGNGIPNNWTIVDAS